MLNAQIGTDSARALKDSALTELVARVRGTMLSNC